MQFFTLSVVVILGFASYGPAGAQEWVGFPLRDPATISHECVLRSYGTHQVTFSDIQTLDDRYFHRHLVSSLDWISSSDSMVFLEPSLADINLYDINSQADCAIVSSANGYNSFIYNTTHCIGYTYQASACNVGPGITAGDLGPFFEIFVATSQKPNSTTQYVPDTSDLTWLNSTDPSVLSARFLIDGLYADQPITELRVRLGNGTEVIYTQSELTSPMTVEVPIEGDCTGQDMTVILLSNSVVVSEKFYPRDVCPVGATDTCSGCVTPITLTRTLSSEEKVAYELLEEGCNHVQSHTVPIITSKDKRDQLLTFIESNPDVSPDSFWVGFTRSSESSSFSWPDGSQDLSMFGNGKSFTPKTGEDCSIAYVDLVSMDLMIESASCTQKHAGICVS